jgi:pimeloyl-ACP methyl ester carboxylesterase
VQRVIFGESILMKDPAPPWKVIPLRDGRNIGYADYGEPTGIPVIAFHGMPGSRLMMQSLHSSALLAGARLIAPERPGYGYSSPHPAGSLRSYAHDIADVADALGLSQFTVVGASGGGPYALACAAHLGTRIRAAGLISAIGPLSVPPSTSTMPWIQRWLFGLGRIAPTLFGFTLACLTKANLPFMEKHVRAGTSPSPSLSPALFAIVVADQREALRAGTKGLTYDIKGYWQPWGFDLTAIQPPVSMWHGMDDTFAPVARARYLADRLPHCTATFYPHEGHTDLLVNHGDTIVAALVEASR